MGMLALCREKFGTAYMHPEKWHKAGFGSMWSVIGEVFYFFVYYYCFYYYFHFIFCIPQTNYCFAWGGGIGVLPPYPQQCEGHASRLMWGMSQTMVWGSSWNLGGWSENNKCFGL